MVSCQLVNQRETFIGIVVNVWLRLGAWGDRFGGGSQEGLDGGLGVGHGGVVIGSCKV